jgi:hypothetical protein
MSSNNLLGDSIESWPPGFAPRNLVLPPVIPESTLQNPSQLQAIFLMLCLHVDKQVIAVNNRSTVKKFKFTLNTVFEYEDGGRSRLHLHQRYLYIDCFQPEISAS